MKPVSDADPLVCHKCRAAATRDRAGRLEPCKACGATYFLRTSQLDLFVVDGQRAGMRRAGDPAPLRLTPADRRFLKSMRISTEGLTS